MTLNMVCLAVVMVLQLGDVYTTLKVISQGGREVWKTTAWMMQRIGTVPAVILLKGWFGAIAVWLSLYEQADVLVATVPTWWVLATMAVPYACLVRRNWGYIKR